MKSLEKITAYKCRWCGKVFMRSTHDCKFDPEKTNCLSCEKCLGVDIEDGSHYFVCADEIYPPLPEVADGQWASSGDKGNRRYKMRCGSYKPLKNYEGSKTYAAHLQEISCIKFMDKIAAVTKEDWQF